MTEAETVDARVKEIIELSAAVSKLCRNDSTTVGSAMVDIARLKSGVDNFNATFQTIYTLLDGQEVKKFRELLGSLDGCITVLHQTKNNLDASVYNSERHALE
ncbi:hypothetical protein NW762_000278 [Fusarium torreyae]|uniref:Uncharacterized protein n=1 Tax=Fusarium torreyae TaxID=1237075 RepID=A0A9W8SG23_9HYPO|nr:hypothetical protein NW762_000278 [Fusarium torreyae]